MNKRTRRLLLIIFPLLIIQFSANAADTAFSDRIRNSTDDSGKNKRSANVVTMAVHESNNLQRSDNTDNEITVPVSRHANTPEIIRYADDDLSVFDTIETDGKLHLATDATKVTLVINNLDDKLVLTKTYAFKNPFGFIDLPLPVPNGSYIITVYETETHESMLHAKVIVQ